MKKSWLLIILTAAFIIIPFLSVLAADTSLILEYRPPCLSPDNCPSGEDFISYIRRIYLFSMGLAGILAVGVIVAGAIYYSVSGAIDKKNEARSMITSALWGVVLLFGSYLILNTINPQIVALKRPGLPDVSQYVTSTFAMRHIDCPNLSNTGCFFNDEGEACDPEDTSAVCSSVDRSTPICRLSGTATSGANGTNWIIPACACEECQALANNIPLKYRIGCKDSTNQACFLNQLTKYRTIQFINALRNSVTAPSNWIWPAIRFLIMPGSATTLTTLYRPEGMPPPIGTESDWRVTEAFPPSRKHFSLCHYNGRCFDFGKSSLNSPNSTFINNPNNCVEVLFMARVAAMHFNNVLIEGLANNDCPNIPMMSNIENGSSIGRANSATTRGFHLHIFNPISR